MNGKTIGYWLSTGFLALGALASGLGDVVAAPAVLEGILALGYPAYFATLLGTWKILGVLAVLSPGLPRLKEWAYAGFVFTWTGAIVSHLAIGDVAGTVPTVLLLLATAASWSLRPASRTLEVDAFTPALAK